MLLDQWPQISASHTSDPTNARKLFFSLYAILLSSSTSSGSPLNSELSETLGLFKIVVTEFLHSLCKIINRKKLGILLGIFRLKPKILS